MKDRLTVKEAASILEKSEEFVRYRLEMDMLREEKGQPRQFLIGYCYRTRGKRLSYEIYRKMLLRYMDATAEDLSEEKRRILE